MRSRISSLRDKAASSRKRANQISRGSPDSTEFLSLRSKQPEISANFFLFLKFKIRMPSILQISFMIESFLSKKPWVKH